MFGDHPFASGQPGLLADTSKAFSTWPRVPPELGEGIGSPPDLDLALLDGFLAGVARANPTQCFWTVC